MNDDELTALGIKLFIETHKESKNMEEEKKVGLLARDFIKEHIPEAILEIYCNK